MDIKFSIYTYLLFILFHLKYFLLSFCFKANVGNMLDAKWKNDCSLNSNRFNKSSNIFRLSLIFRKLKDQSMVKSIPSHIRRRNKKKKKKKKKKEAENTQKKKVNRKLERRRRLKFYKLKRKNEGINDNIFEEKPKYSVFDYIEDKLKGTSYKEGESTSRDINMSGQLSSLEEPTDTKKAHDNYAPEITETVRKNENTNETTNDEIIRSETDKRRKKKPKKLKKNMHIGRYRRKIFTYKPKMPVDQIHDYVTSERLKDPYILTKDPLKNVFVNMPLFNFYNFYNYFQIDHIEKYNKSKILNLIYYYLYKYKKDKPYSESTTYQSVNTNELMGTYYNKEAPIDNKNIYENSEKDETKMKHYLELYINMNNNKYLFMNVDKNFTLKNKIKDPFTISNINKVDSLHIHNYKIVWTIRNVKEKMFWRYREMGNTPLTTSPFSFAGKKLFKLKIWLDGHKSAKKNYVSIGLKQLQHYDVLNEYLCFSLNEIKRGPLVYMSKEYYQTCYNFCKLEDLDLKKDELEFSMFLYDGVV